MRDRFRKWWGGLKPYQRELGFTVAFDVAVLLLLFVPAVLGMVAAWPWLIENPAGLVALSAVGGVSGLAIAISGQLLGYRVEDRRAARRKSENHGNVR